jgi:diguanylate cyclase (GGDEF)-like protein
MRDNALSEPLVAAAPDRILIVDRDAGIANFVKLNLEERGFVVQHVADGAAALQMIRTDAPALVLTDLDLPGLDGLEMIRRLRADPMLSALPLIILTGRGMSIDKVAGFSAGADDYVVKPFDTLELVARVTNTLRRNKEFREVSPLTELPGNTRILREISERVRLGYQFAVSYIDIDRFKAVNDVYGFGRGDEFIQALAKCLRRAVAAIGDPPVFLGHVGGDDFILICSPEQLSPLTKFAVMDFERTSAAMYDPPDALRGYVEIVNRRGEVLKVSLVSLSIGVAMSTQRRFTDPREVVAVASEMKSVAKKHFGSYVAVDRRADGVPASR